MSLIIVIQFLILCVGLYLVIKGADVLLSSATALGKKFKISDFLIGLVVIGFGTSISELLVSIKAVLDNSPNLSVGNVIGSNISNIILVLGFTLTISSVQFKELKKSDIFFHLFIHLIFFIIFYFFTFVDTFGYLFITIFFIYIIKSFRKSSSNQVNSIELENDIFSLLSYEKPIKFGFLIILISIVTTLFGAQLTVSSAIKISKMLNISDTFLGLSIIAIGTSLPEIATSMRAIRKKRSDIVIGNIIGSNIYNLLLVLGTSSLLSGFYYDKHLISLEIYFLIICVLMLSFLLLVKFQFKKNHFPILLFSYLGYLYYLFNSNFWVLHVFHLIHSQKFNA